MKPFKHPLIASAIMFTLMSLATGCTTDGDAEADRDASRDTTRIGDTRISFPTRNETNPDSISTSSDRDTIREDRPRDETTTVEPRVELKNEIPSDAVQLKEWQDGQLSHEASEPGFVYIFDEADNRIVYSGHLHRGERFVLDRENNRGTINGVVVYSQESKEPRNYKVYFDRD